MRESLHKTGDNAVVQVGYDANVPYFLCYGLETMGVPCYNIIPRSILRSKYARIFYGSTYCRYLNINCVWLHNPLDPIIFSELKSRTKPWSTDSKIIFIPTRFDRIKGLNTFFDLLIDGLHKNTKILSDSVLYIIAWPNTASEMNSYINFLRNKGVKIKILSLLSRKELLEMYYKSNIVVGQFVSGILSLTELEALALQNYVITKPLDVAARLAYRINFNIQTIPVSEIQNLDDLIHFLDSISQKPNLEGHFFCRKGC